MAHQQQEMKQTLREAPYVTAPPPMGYLVMMNGSPQTVQQPTQSNKGSGGFLRGWYYSLFTLDGIIFTWMTDSRGERGGGFFESQSQSKADEVDSWISTKASEPRRIVSSNGGGDRFDIGHGNGRNDDRTERSRRKRSQL